MPSVYLCGPILHASREELDGWHSEVEKSLDRTITVLKPVPMQEYPATLKDAKRAITGRDRMYVSRADMIIANFTGTEKVSIGSVMELAWADVMRIPVIMVIEDDGNVHDHNMLTSVVDFRVPTLQDAIKLVNFSLAGV